MRGNKLYKLNDHLLSENYNKDEIDIILTKFTIQQELIHKLMFRNK